MRLGKSNCSRDTPFVILSTFGSVIEGEQSDRQGERNREKRDKKTREKTNEPRTFPQGIPQTHFSSRPGFMRVHTPYQPYLTELKTLCHSIKRVFPSYLCIQQFYSPIFVFPLSYLYKTILFLSFSI